MEIAQGQPKPEFHPFSSRIQLEYKADVKTSQRQCEANAKSRRSAAPTGRHLYAQTITPTASAVTNKLMSDFHTQKEKSLSKSSLITSLLHILALNKTKRRFPFHCQTRLLQMLHIYIYTQTPLFRSLILERFWRGVLLKSFKSKDFELEG